MTPYRRYLADGILPAEPEEGKNIKRNAARYTLVDGILFRHGFTHPMMEEGQAQLHKKDKTQDMSIQSQTKSV